MNRSYRYNSRVSCLWIVLEHFYEGLHFFFPLAKLWVIVKFWNKEFIVKPMLSHLRKYNSHTFSNYWSFLEQRIYSLWIYKSYILERVSLWEVPIYLQVKVFFFFFQINNISLNRKKLIEEVSCNITKEIHSWAMSTYKYLLAKLSTTIGYVANAICKREHSSSPK